MADHVMTTPDALASRGSSAIPSVVIAASSGAIHRACAQCAEDKKDKDDDGQASEGPDVQRSAAAPAASTSPAIIPTVGPTVAAHIQALRGSGEPLPAATTAFFAPRFGFDFANIRVHTDARAAATARQLQARAFTVGQDIVFAGGEYNPRSPAGMHLLAHELAHVVQQAPGVSRLIQRAPDDGAAAEAPAPDAPAAPGLIVDDEVEPSQVQMRKGEFLGALRPMVEQAIAASFTSQEARAQITPLLEDAFASAEAQGAGELERGLQQQAPEASKVRTAAEYFPIVVARARQAVGGSAAPAPAGAEGGSSTGVARKARGAASPQVVAAPAVRAQLGSGSPIDGGVRSRMESGFGIDFSHVRVHTDPGAARLAERLEASAFTVGEHVAFGSGEYRPGTTEGDMLLAHELAHVAQQKGAAAQSSTTSEQALERDADASAETVVGRLWRGVKRRWSGERGTGPRLKSGVRLQRKIVDYRLQNTSGFDVCIFCICEPTSEAPDKKLLDPRTLPSGKCPAGLEVDSVSGCVGFSERSRENLPANPCPTSTHICQ